uniref:Uncharacterized protein n=1 Tax=Arundo donax TaxID=35708 RepID=A0A0A8YDE7_ARUDO
MIEPLETKNIYIYQPNRHLNIIIDWQNFIQHDMVLCACRSDR